MQEAHHILSILVDKVAAYGKAIYDKEVVDLDPQPGECVLIQTFILREGTVKIQSY